MPTSWISYRIANVGDRADRERNLRYRISRLGGPSWGETTSFVVIDCSYTSREIAENLKGAIDRTCDRLVVGSLVRTKVYAAGSIPSRIQLHYLCDEKLVNVDGVEYPFGTRRAFEL